MGLTVLLGGARSGKSTLAVDLAGRTGAAVTYIATAEARDEEMSARIEAHRKQRPPHWTTVEEPLDLVVELNKVRADEAVIVDCLTLWVANLIEHDIGDSDVIEKANVAAGVAAGRKGQTIVITNEVGSGLVPMDPLGRRYRDLLGIVNSRWSALAQDAFLVVAGKVLALSPSSDIPSSSL